MKSNVGEATGPDEEGSELLVRGCTEGWEPAGPPRASVAFGTALDQQDRRVIKAAPVRTQGRRY